jgi:hypothetical protein
MHGGRKVWALVAVVVALSALTASPAGALTRYVPQVEQPDNAASFTWSQNGQNGAASSAVAKPGDPLTFYVYGGPPAPGSNAAYVEVQLINNGPTEIRFPAGLTVPVILRSGLRMQMAVVRHPATRLAPGAGLMATTTVPLHAYGQYSVSAFTVVQMPRG